MTALSQTQFNEALYLSTLAHEIVDESPRRALHANLSDRESREWTWAARDYLNALNDGLEDDGEFGGMVDEFFNPPADQSWALDCDFLRDERVSFGMGGARG